MPGVGRLTIRTQGLSLEARKQLDLYIVRAKREGHTDQLLLLKLRKVSVHAFMDAAKNNRLPTLRPSPVLRPLVDEWLAAADVRESSRARYEQSWRLLKRALPVDAALASLTNDFWSSYCEQRHVGPATLNRDRAAVNAFLSWAKAKGFTMPEFRVDKRKEEPHRSDILTLEQVKSVREKCRPDRWPLFWTLIATGARQGEMLNLQCRDVTLDPPMVAIRSQPGSKSRAERSVPIGHDLAKVLRGLATLNPGGRVFPHCRTTIRDWWAALAESAGVSGVTLHGLRATFITHALDAGVPPSQVQKLAGHANIEQTMRYYRNDVESQSAAATIRAVLGV